MVKLKDVKGMIKTVSLQTAKLLKEAGFNQELKPGDWYWFVAPSGKVRLLLLSENEDLPYSQYEWYKAIATDELLEQLPLTIRGDKLRLSRISNGSWIGQYGVIIPKEALVSDLSLCEVLSAMWLRLKKEGLIK